MDRNGILATGMQASSAKYEILDYRPGYQPTVEEKIKEYFANTIQKSIDNLNTTLFSDNAGNILGSVWTSKSEDGKMATQISTKDGIYHDIDGDNRIEQFHKIRQSRRQ